MDLMKNAEPRWLLSATLLAALPLLAACEGAVGPAGPPGPEGSAAVATCGGCHDPSTNITAKTMQWEKSKHAWGGNFVRGTSATCAGCHSSEGFTTRIAAGLQPNQLTSGVANPTPIKCRTCHEIHTTHTEADWALRVRDPVTLMVSGATFDKGAGNLCASCHQPRAGPPEIGSGEVQVTSGSWGPHRSQAAALLGIGGYSSSSAPGVHYMAVQNSCVTCHMGPERVHTKTAQLAGCRSCHEGLSTFDRNGVQTEVKALYAELGKLLLANGILRSNGQAAVGTHPEVVAGALWNYRFVYYDRSYGVHNPGYVKGLLQASIDALK
jgi:hypothetical protein